MVRHQKARTGASRCPYALWEPWGGKVKLRWEGAISMNGAAPKGADRGEPLSLRVSGEALSVVQDRLSEQRLHINERISTEKNRHN